MMSNLPSKSITLLLTILLLTVSYLFGSAPQKDHPNIIFILADDLGYGDLGVTGHPYAKSPNLDTLASQGTRFTQAYMSAAWCAPSRYSLMSGIFPAREFSQSRLLPVDIPNVASVLKSVGYTTAHYGKWHMGDQRNNAPAPAAYGLDESFSTQSSGPTWPREARKDPHYREKTTPYYVNLAIDFIKRNKDQPFYINLWIYPTHSYINPTPEQLAVYDDLRVDIHDFESPLQREFLEFVSRHGDVQDAMRAYCADVTAMDKEIGRLLNALEEMELEENTMVIFSSDNGPGPVSNNWDDIIERYKEQPKLLNNVGSAGEFRERKISLHEGGIRVPLIIRWPAKTPAGRVDAETVFVGADYLPSLASLVSAPISQSKLDGQDLSAAFTGTAVERSKPIFWSDNPKWVAMRDGDWKAHIQNGKFKLYNLASDPSESEDLSASKPELTQKYRKMLLNWSKVIHK